MNFEKTKAALENIYTDYFDGLYNDHQLKFMIKEIGSKTEISFEAFAELCLDVQWAV